eukprot:CAMPEP_0117540740 /NCGR_PEP_ID=MMETSP0784-20121206/43655_1 /TAXON_ID=39447 /ORGANISM="" /LENGTH=115 /DNA_ID=CAMNT_0005337405 /DNA_START=80 /DNA_END=424 /DNA_ORIENTATION=-
MVVACGLHVALGVCVWYAFIGDVAAASLLQRLEARADVVDASGGAFLTASGLRHRKGACRECSCDPPGTEGAKGECVCRCDSTQGHRDGEAPPPPEPPPPLPPPPIFSAPPPAVP